MKILQLRFKNLNSLNGEWSIDFTSPEYAADGIFAITGPTGAGKTTILDAICLALYGRTPRLPRITKSENEIISRHAGECFAEVIFKNMSGRFRCHWSQHRARKKSNGDLQPPRHEIADDATGAILESKIRDVSEAVESKTGMDFSRFTRSILLAQGGFAAFLKADANERSGILEKLTGFEIYTEISMMAHKRKKEERAKLDQLQTALSGIQLIGADQKQKLIEDLKDKQNKEAELIEKNDQLIKALSWLESIDKLKTELKTIDKEFQRYKAKQKEFEPKSKKLKKANLAAEIEFEYQTLDLLKKRLQSSIKDLKDTGTGIPKQKKTLLESETSLKEAEQDLRQKKDHQKKELKIIKRVRELDLEIRENKKVKKSYLVDIQKLKKKIENIDKKKSETELELKSVGSHLSLIKQYLSSHRSDASLVSELTGIKQILKQLRTGFDKISLLDKSLEDNREKVLENSILYKKQEKYVTERKRLKDSLEKRIMKIFDLLKTKLDWQDSHKLYNKREELKERFQVLTRLSDLLIKINADEKRLLALNKEAEIFKKDRTSLTELLKRISKRCNFQEREVERAGELIDLLKRIKSLEAQRAMLKDGHPCPLCGSEKHPYAKEDVHNIDKTEKSLNKADILLKDLLNKKALLNAEKAKLKDFLDQKTSLQIEAAKIEKDMDLGRLKIKEIQLQIKKRKKEKQEYICMLGIDDSKGINIETESALIKEQIDNISKSIQEIESLEKELKNKRDKKERLYKSYTLADKEFQETKHKKNSLKDESKRISKEYDSVVSQCKAENQKAGQKLKKYGVTQIEKSKIDNISQELEARLQAWQENTVKKEGLKKELLFLEADIDKQKVLLNEHLEHIESKNSLLKTVQNRIDSLTVKRWDLYGTKDADKKDAELQSLVEQAEKRMNHLRNTRDLAKQDIQDTKSKIASLNEQARKLKNDIVRYEKTFTESLYNLGFKDKEDYISASLSKQERVELNKMAADLRKEHTELKTGQRNAELKLSKELKKNLTDKTKEFTQNELNNVTQALKGLCQEIGAVKQKLSDNEKKLCRQKERLDQIDNQNREYIKWKALDRLIGSANGAKYRNFAQGLTFKHIVAEANQNLQKMTDRYLLIQDDAGPLELNVIDNYQAGEIRSTKNLSGGESFIVSLSLALSLSNMAGRKIRVDSLFLDEGFGTLDDEALQTSLETLSGLQREGKLIGVISHVPALKERIRNQIRVFPKTGGQSGIRGPGCFFLN